MSLWKIVNTLATLSMVAAVSFGLYTLIALFSPDGDFESATEEVRLFFAIVCFAACPVCYSICESFFKRFEHPHT